MSQQQINRISAKTYLESANCTLLREADLYYLEDNFILETKYNRHKFLHAQLYKEALCTDDCEVLNWVDKKIRGALECEDIQVVDLKSLQTKKRDITINNYYNQYWSTIEW